MVCRLKKSDLALLEIVVFKDPFSDFKRLVLSLEFMYTFYDDSITDFPEKRSIFWLIFHGFAKPGWTAFIISRIIDFVCTLIMTALISLLVYCFRKLLNKNTKIVKLNESLNHKKQLQREKMQEISTTLSYESIYLNEKRNQEHHLKLQ